MWKEGNKGGFYWDNGKMETTIWGSGFRVNTQKQNRDKEASASLRFQGWEMLLHERATG